MMRGALLGNTLRAGLCRRYGETKRDYANFRNCRQDASHGGVSYRRLEATGSGRVTPMCAVHTSFLLTLLTMSNTMGFAKKRVISKTAVPTIFPSKLALSQCSLSQSLDAEARLSWAGQRTVHASAVATLSKQVFVNKNTGVSLIWITTLDTYVICLTVRHDAQVYEIIRIDVSTKGMLQTRVGAIHRWAPRRLSE